MVNRDFLKTKIGFEMEFTGITRKKAADVVAKHLEGTIKKKRDGYDTHEVTAPALKSHRPRTQNSQCELG